MNTKLLQYKQTAVLNNTAMKVLLLDLHAIHSNAL